MVHRHRRGRPGRSPRPARPATHPALMAPQVFTIPATLPFLDALVAGLFERYGRSPLDLAEATILLPSRRAVRALSDAFLKAGGGTPMLLPRLAALGDIDADEIGLSAGDGLADTLD